MKLEDAIALAAQAHAGQVDKGGAAYILHPLRVMLACTTPEQRIAAVLHDTVEDCGIELDTIRQQFGGVVADAVDALTKRHGETYDAFVERCSTNDVARQVKLADIADNSDLSRLGREPTDTDRQRLSKYRAARERLLASERARSAL